MGKAGVRKADTYTTTELGSKVICENKDLLYEEVPSAYKEIQDIVQDLVDFNLVKVVAVFRPLITYKMRVVKYEK
jgi:release factor H-coupled RctB family protein